LGLSFTNRDCVLKMPNGRETPLTTDRHGVIRDLDVPTVGIYSVFDSTRHELRRFAVNTPVEESDLTSISQKEFQQSLARVTEARSETLSASLFGSGDNQKELWRVLLLTALAVLFVEMFLANRTLA